MKNSVILTLTTVFVVLFSAAPVFAQRGSGSRFEDYFGRIDSDSARRVGVAPATAGSSVIKEEVDDPLSLTYLEIAKIFTESNFAISEEGDIKDFVAKVTVFSRERTPRVGGSGYYRYYYHREPESVVFVSLENTDGDTKIIGRGDNTNLRKAAEEAAKNAAKKLKKKLGEMKPVIFLPLP